MTKTPAVLGIALDDFQSWRNHPVTLVFRQYLRDYADALGRKIVSEFIDGRDLNEATQYEARGRIRAAQEAAELEFEAIFEFYQIEEEEHATEIAQD